MIHRVVVATLSRSAEPSSRAQAEGLTTKPVEGWSLILRPAFRQAQDTAQDGAPVCAELA